MEKQQAVLLLEDGTVYYGTAIGKKGTTTGELCFNTGMTGYQEIFTDPSYYGQLMVMTNVHIGNYGVIDEEQESDTIKIAGLICKDFNVVYSRKNATTDISDYFIKQNIVGIADVDTREIVRHIRNKGAMNAIVSSEEMDIEKLKKLLGKAPSMQGLELSSKVSTRKPYFFGKADAKYKIAALDLGIKKNILRCLAERDCYIKVFPHNTSLKEMKEWNPDAYFLSNGPGDPAAMPDVVKTIQEIIKDTRPVFGICLGHQLIAEASGVHTFKMHHGHRGINHPVKNLITGKCEITSQNHGFAVSVDAVDKKNTEIEITHINLNDNTIAGLRLKNKPVFSVQYHPEASPGPHDSRYLFDQFISIIAAEKNKSSEGVNKTAPKNLV